MGTTSHLEFALLSSSSKLCSLLLVRSVTAQAAKYDYDSYETSYGRDVHYEEPSYTYKASPMYRRSYESRYKRSTGGEAQALSEAELRSFSESVREMPIEQGMQFRKGECSGFPCEICLPIIGCHCLC